MPAANFSPLECWQASTEDSLRFRVQATKVEPRADAQLSVTVTVLIKANETDQAALEAKVQDTLQALVPTNWVFSSFRREGESMGFERGSLEALARVPITEVHNLKQRARNASCEGLEVGTPTVSYRLPEDRINAIQSKLRLKVIEEVKKQQDVLTFATKRYWRIGSIDFGTRKSETDEGETRFSKGGYRTSAEEPFEGGGMAGAERFTLLAEVILRSRFHDDDFSCLGTVTEDGEWPTS